MSQVINVVFHNFPILNFNMICYRTKHPHDDTRNPFVWMLEISDHNG